MEGAQTPTNNQQRVVIMANPTVNFMGYNSTGIDKQKCAWISDLCDLTDTSYLSIQEHFKIAKTRDKYFNDQFEKFNSYVIPGHRAKGQDSGRPKAGLAQLSKKDLDIRKDRIVTKSFRIQAQLLNFSSSRLLWINAYLPTDPQNGAFDESELLEVLTEVESIMDKTAFDDILWQGDLNWDMSRNSEFAIIMRRFMTRIGMVSLWERYPVDYTHLHTDYKSTSVIDHFMMNERLLSLVEDCGPLHLGDNRSRHSPIMVKLNLGAIPVKQKVNIKTPKRPAWYKATEDDILSYTGNLDSRMQGIIVPESIHCVNTECSNPSHSSERDSVVLDMLVSIIEVSHSHIPMVGGKTVKTGARDKPGEVPGWKDMVQPFQDDAQFWHSIWRSAARPSSGVLHSIMVKTRNSYHYAIRRARKSSDLIRAKKLFEAAESGSMDLLQELKNIRMGGKSSADLPDNVAGANGEEEIVAKFRDVYSSLYNSWGTQAEMVSIKEQLPFLMQTEDSLAEVQKLTGLVVKKAACKMKAGKSDVSGAFSSDALLHAPDSVFDMLAMVYRSWLVHGTVTLSLLACAFLPLLKNALKDPADTNSYRAIAGSSLLLKLFDQCVLVVWGHLMVSDSLQFGYKEGTGTTQCSWMVMEVANHYMRNGTNPIMTLLDCSKAFDMCKYSILFRKLLKKGLPAVVVRTLITVYEQQYAWVRWGRAKSEMFPIVNGTRQGSVLSPTLFAIYMDEILVTLRNLGVGCYVGEVFMGAMGYADDLVMLAPSRTAMQLMLTACEEFGAENNLIFSTDPDPNKSKTKCVFLCGKKKVEKPLPLRLYGNDLPWVKTATHLGNELCEDGTMDTDTRQKRAAFIDRSLQVREQFSFAHPMETLRAVNIYCCDHYGGMLWDLQGNMASQYFSAWSTCIKLAWGVPRATHNYFLDYLCGGLVSVKRDILSRYAGFYRSLLYSPSREVAILARIVAKDIRTTTARNLRLLEVETGGGTWAASLTVLKDKLKERDPVVPAEDRWRVPYLGKLLEERDMLLYKGLADTEPEVESVQRLIDSLCTN